MWFELQILKTEQLLVMGPLSVGTMLVQAYYVADFFIAVELSKNAELPSNLPYKVFEQCRLHLLDTIYTLKQLLDLPIEDFPEHVPPRPLPKPLRRNMHHFVGGIAIRLRHMVIAIEYLNPSATMEMFLLMRC